MIEFQIDGQNYRFPEWATESTQVQLRDLMAELAKRNGVSNNALNRILKAQEDALEELKDQAKGDKKSEDDKKKADDKLIKKLDEMVEGLDEVRDATQEIKVEVPKSFRDQIADTLERDGEYLGGALLGAAGTVVKFGGVIGGTLLTGAGFVGNKLMEAGTTVNELVQSGVGFNTTFSEMGMGVVEATGHLGALGLGFGEAAELMKRSSAVIATQGFKRFEQTMQFAADTSEELGMSFDESMNKFGEALTRRQRMLNIGSLDQGRLNAQIAKTTKVQTAYATALGVSTETLQAFVDGLLNNNGLLTSSILRFSNTVRADLVAGIEVFASGLAAMGGKSGEDIAAAFLEAGSAGAIGLSDAAVGLVTALPNLAGPMNQFIKGIQSGTMNQDEANDMVQGLSKNLGNLSNTEKERIRLLARTGDQSAQMLANAIAQFEQSESKIKEINKALGTGFDMDMVQKGRNEFAKTMAQISGGAENAFFSLFADPEITKALTDGFKEILGVFGMGVDDTGKVAQDMGKTVKKFVPIVKNLVTGAVTLVKDLLEYFKGFMGDDGFDFSGLIGDLIGKALGAAVKGLLFAIPSFALALFGLAVAKTAVTNFLMPQIQSFTSALFSKGSELAKKVGETALGFAKSMFDSKGGKATQAFMGKAAGFIKDKAGGISEKIQSSPIGQKVADKLGSFQKDGAKMTEKLQGSMTKGGSSGGFLKSIADGVAKFGDTKVVKGAASLTLLAGAVTLTAIGLKKFNDVDFMSVVKGTVAMAGLATMAQFLGKGSTAMVKGAAAILLLGTAVVPMAFGLSLMKDVGLDTIGIMAAGLVTLGIAAAGLGLALPFILSGAAAIGALGLALIPFGIALNLVSLALPTFTESMDAMSKIDGGGLLNAAGGMLAIGGAMALMAPLLPFMLIGTLAAPAIFAMASALKSFNDVDMFNLLLAGEAMKSIGSGMSTLSGGSLMSSLKDGIGSLFGADSPIDKIKKFADGLSEIDVHPLLDVSYGLESIVDSSQRLPQAAAGMLMLAELSKPFVDGMSRLSRSLDKMGQDPFEKFSTLEQHAESMNIFRGSIDGVVTGIGNIQSSLDTIDGDYISDQFYVIGDSIEYMNEQLSNIKMGDMLKLGAMKLLGPSKEEKEEEAQTQAVKNIASEKLYGEDMMSGLTGIMRDISQDNFNSDGIFRNMEAIQAAGIDIDVSKLIGSSATDIVAEEGRILSALQQQIDMYKMQESTGIASPALIEEQKSKADIKLPVPLPAQAQVRGSTATVDPASIPVIGARPEDQNQQPQQPQPTTPTVAETQKETQDGTVMMSQQEMLAELIRLQAENNRLVKKQIKATGELDL